MQKYKTPCYVLASKYRDGDPRDPWVVGYLKSAHFSPDGKVRYEICNHLWETLSIHLYSRMLKISEEEGAWILNNRVFIEKSAISVFTCLRLHRKR